MPSLPAPAAVGPLTVVLPVGTAAGALVVVAALAPHWPVDARLVLLGAFDDQARATLSVVEGAVELLETSGATLGAGLLTAAQDLPGPVLVLDDAVLPPAQVLGALLARPRPGVPGTVLTTAAELSAAPALAHATGLATVDALLGAHRRHGPVPPQPPAGAERLISVALIVRDEQDLLAPCLAAAHDVADEVVVCDTGSVDATREIAAAMGARVVSTEWTDDFAAARNTVLASCTGEWTLSLDADELLVVPDPAGLRRALRRSTCGVHAVRIDNLSSTGEVVYSHPGDRLFRTATHRWVGAVHERLVHAGDGSPAPVAPLDGVHLRHSGYTPELVAAKDKTARNLRLAERDFASVSSTPGHPRYWKTAYELGRVLDLLGDPRCPEFLALALPHVPAGEPGLRAVALVKLGTWAAHAGDDAVAEERAREALRTVPDEPNAALLLADVLSRTGRREAAVELLGRLGPAPAGLSDRHARTVRVPVRLAELHLDAGRADAAASLLRPVLAEHGLGEPGWSVLLRALHDLGRPGWVEEVARLAGSHSPLVVALAGCLPPEAADALRARLTPAGDLEAARSAELDRATAGTSPAALAAAARELERTDPSTALALWERVAADVPGRALGRARCLVALGRDADAGNALDGVDPTVLDDPDRLFAAALALGLGDTGTAAALLAGDVRPELRPEVDALRSLLPGATVPVG